MCLRWHGSPRSTRCLLDEQYGPQSSTQRLPSHAQTFAAMGTIALTRSRRLPAGVAYASKRAVVILHCTCRYTCTQIARRGHRAEGQSTSRIQAELVSTLLIYLGVRSRLWVGLRLGLQS